MLTHMKYSSFFLISTLHVFFSFIKTLFAMLSAVKITFITELMQYELSNVQQHRYLHFVKKLKNYINDIINIMCENYCVLFINKNIYYLLK